MLTLALMRHAKSSWSDPDLDDCDRPLTKRGTKSVPPIARYLEQNGLVPQLVLCSTAVRTRATLTLLMRELTGKPPAVAYEDGLYLAAPATIMSFVKEVPAGVRTVLVIGHNPGLHALALELTGKGDKRLVGAMAREFPTAALAVLTFPGEAWTGLGPAEGTLQHFTTPRRLEAR